MNGSRSDRIVPWIAYPGVMAVAVLLHFAMQAAGFALAVSTYFPVSLAAFSVALLEARFPNRSAWRPRTEDLRADLLFMVAVQLTLPPIAGYLFVLGLVEPVRALGLPGTRLWPHHWPVFGQAALVIVMSDFLRYWLHRAAHTWLPLWRLHAVHHSVDRLYWLNVGRFHPVEKVLQLVFDTFPFVLLGVGPEVISLHFLLYGVNGFFQHSNVALRYGVLNYVVGSAETHRFHHSRDAAESNHNYGNNLIIWDLAFGTFYLPAREVGALGLRNANYPMRFGSQMLTPFTADLTDRDVPLARPRDWARRVMQRAMMTWCQWRYLNPVLRATRHPATTQARVLMDIVRANDRTRFGREHVFSTIRSVEDFQRAVPAADYERLRPYVDEQAETGAPALTAARPVLYAQTSGTTGKPKRIPLTRVTIAQYASEQRLFSCLQYHACRTAFSGKALGIMGAAVETHLPSGAPVGSISGHLYASMPRFVQKGYVVPAEVFSIDDYEQRYLTILRLALAEPDVTYMGGANPSAFLRLLTLLNERREVLLDDLERGRHTGDEQYSPAARDAIGSRLAADPPRANALRGITGDLTFANVWPNIRLVTTWTGGSCGIALASLKERLPAGARVMDLGYLSSEVRGTITMDAESGAGLPMLHHVFFEFAETSHWDAGRRETLLLDEIAEGRDYYVIVTTGAGLYRYFMNDIVRVVGRVHATPLLRFVQKGKGVTSITGEKLYESQVIEAVRSATSAQGSTSLFFMMLADDVENGYRLYIEMDVAGVASIQATAAAVERHLRDANLEYDTKRASGRLHPLRVFGIAAGTGDRYKAHCVAAGQREGQFKPVVLQYARECRFPFDEYRSE